MTKYHPQPFTLAERVESNYTFALKQSPERYDPTRLAKAKQLALDPEKFQASIAKYETTLWRCLCPDHAYRTTIACKHMLARMLEGYIFA